VGTIQKVVFVLHPCIVEQLSDSLTRLGVSRVDDAEAQTGDRTAG
jgi:hypothetical protein